MSSLRKAHVEEHLAAYRERDPELYAELKRKLARPLEPAVTEATRRMRFGEGVPLVADSGEMTARGRMIAESIVRPEARPVLVIRDNRATTEFLGPDSQVWAGRIQEAQAILDRAIPSVGRVEVSNNPSYSWVGTGWLVADDIIVTNRHVAREFGRRGSSGFVFRLGINGGPQSARVDFLEEFQRATSLEFGVVAILWIASPSDPDVAFMRVRRQTGGRSLPSPISLAVSVDVDTFVATIGYPARDDRVPDQALVQKVFGDVYDKKRLAPGQVTSAGDEEIEHDCSTLGGNSGSVVLNLRTGEAVGLHFAGLFLQANYAVAAPKVRELLRKVQLGELPAAIPAIAPALTAPAGPAHPVGPVTYTIQMQIPVEITIRVGTSTMTLGPGMALPGVATPPAAGDPFAGALAAARDALAGNPDVVEIRLGYRFKRGWITDERVIVVEVKEKLSVTALRSAGKSPIPSHFLGVGVDVRTAGLRDQLEHLGVDLAALEAPPRPGAYREPPDLSLDLVRERMQAIFHASPDSGFPNLKAFLNRVRNHLTATMYEWEPNHISDVIASAMAPDGRSLKMVTQFRGTNDAVNDMRQRIGSKFTHVWSSVNSGKLFPSSYHIKVASRDGEEFWLSSGNWKDSNQADIDPAGENATSIIPLRQHNREWHAIIANAKLATLFQKYIDWDFSEAQRVPFEEGPEVPLTELFVPEAVFAEDLERRAAARYFDPLELDEELEVQPLLTPDRDTRGRRVYMDFATQMVQKGTRKIYVENQSFNLLEENVDEFEQFFGALRDKQRAGVDVRIIFRDAREFGASNGPKQQKLLERLKDFGMDTDFIKVQRRCHTKGIIVDGAEVMIGSHNLTNTGSLYNRDASLLVRHPAVAKYFEEIFLFDWEVLAVQSVDEMVGGVRIAQPGEPTPTGFRRVSLAEFLGES
jgi:hypothetical protein